MELSQQSIQIIFIVYLSNDHPRFHGLHFRGMFSRDSPAVESHPDYSVSIGEYIYLPRFAIHYLMGIATTRPDQRNTFGRNERQRIKGG